MDYFTACKRYSLTRYAWDTGTDEGADCADVYSWFAADYAGILRANA